ncbi:MAG: hypothetical protein RLZ45_249 [Verrucomicrobiota bacterium]
MMFRHGLAWSRSIGLIPAMGFLLLATLHAADWPQWLGPKRDAVWRETGIVENFG